MDAQRKFDEDDAGVCSLPRSIRQRVIDKVYQAAGLHLSELTCQFVEKRLYRRMRAVGFQDPEQYLGFVEQHAEEIEHLVNAYTTNETCFFRTQPLWRYLENVYFPSLVEREDSSVPRFWSAACSSGEEAYSMAMLSDHVFDRMSARKRPIVHATDISTDILAKAGAGAYEGRNVNRLRLSRPEMLDSYFESSAGIYQIAPEIRKMVQFSRHNLMEPSRYRETYDLVMLRNVLIYFSQDDQISIVTNIVATMRPGAILAIGESESLGYFDSGLEYVQPFVYRRPEQ